MRNKQSIFILNFAKLIVWAYQQGYELTAGELFRTEEQHQFNLKAGKSKAKRSKHQDRLAGDLNLFINGVYRTDTASYKPLGDYWVSLHKDNVWGGDFNKDGNKTTNDAWDGNHFQMN
jgi:hypothetical protein